MFIRSFDLYMALTDIQIKRAKPQDKPYTLNDGQGLSLLINPDGSKGLALPFSFCRWSTANVIW
ncbi:hypothetical protein HMPREF0880_01427 [Yokenella regensburgei ATCC 43003]|nr:hypothetical protein HMPREF0880_01427 [Yokenella regensburgei ATCC 43003]